MPVHGVLELSALVSSSCGNNNSTKHWTLLSNFQFAGFLLMFFCFADYTDGNCTEFDVRLTYRERNNATGNIEVCRNNEWQSASACSGNFGTQEVAVACRALGFDDFDRTLLTPTIIPPVETITGPVFNGNLPCDGNERDLTVCAGNAKRRKRLICEDNPTANTRVECLGKLRSEYTLCYIFGEELYCAKYNSSPCKLGCVCVCGGGGVDPFFLYYALKKKPCNK